MGMDKLGFGTAGLPKGANKKDPIGALKIAHDLGLDCMELEFAHGIRMKDEMASEINRAARKYGISLTAHAPYYINLNAKEQDKIDASINRLLQTARLAGLCGAYSMTFHAAFYMKDDPKTVYDIVKKYLRQISDKLVDDSNEIQLRPELSGRKARFENLDDLCELSKEVSQVYPSLDFTHEQLTDPSDTTANNFEYFSKVFERYKKSLGKAALSQVHMHLAGIQTGAKGETTHLPLKESTFNYVDFLKACLEHNVRGSIIVESPDQENDALMLKTIWNDLVAQSPKKKSAKKAD